MDACGLVTLLKACAEHNDLLKGRRLHADIVERGLLKTNAYVGNALLNMYGKCGALVKAQEVFDTLPCRDLVSWNALISGYVQHGYGEEALKCFVQMQDKGISLDSVTFVCSLKACGSIGAADKGQEIHAQVVKVGLLGKNVMVGNALVDMYAKCGALAKAQKVFDGLLIQDVVSWSALIAGYVQHGRDEEALSFFKSMQGKGLSPNSVTFICILKACGSLGATEKGQEIHADIVKKGLLEKNILVGTALVDMYAKCGALSKAWKVFCKLPTRDVVSWSALISGYAQHGHGEEAITFYEQMYCEGISPNAITFVCILKACISIGAFDKGEEIHKKIVSLGSLKENVLVGNALVDMYAKSGALAKAQEVFDKFLVKNVVSWSALVAGYAQLGNGDIVFDLFDKMIQDGVRPNRITFIIVLNTCSDLGLLDKAQAYFETMIDGYGIMPTIEHHTCVIDLFGRAGCFDKALRVIKEMPYFVNLTVWHIVLGACQNWKDVKLGKVAFEQAVHLSETDAAAYVCMRKIYVASGMQEDADKIEALRVKNKAWKKQKCHWQLQLESNKY